MCLGMLEQVCTVNRIPLGLQQKDLPFFSSVCPECMRFGSEMSDDLEVIGQILTQHRATPIIL
jgi:hypothetical protein